MIQELYDRHIFLYIMGGLCILGVFLKCFLLIVYNRLIDSSENMNSPKKNWMKNMKLRFEGAYQLQLGVSDVDTYVDKYVSKVKCGGLLLSTWENISGQTIGLCLIVGSFSAILGLVYHCGQDSVLFTFFMGAWTAIIVNIVDNIVNISAHKQMLRYNLIDYFENNLKVRMEQEVFHAEDRKKYQREYFSSDVHRNQDSIDSTCFERKTRREARNVAATKELLENHEKKEIKRLEKRRNGRESDQESAMNHSSSIIDDSISSHERQEEVGDKLTKKQKRIVKKQEKERAKQDKKEQKKRAIQDKLDRKQQIVDEKRQLKIEKQERKKAEKEEKLQAKERKSREYIENKKRKKEEKVKRKEQAEQEQKEESLKNNKAYKEKMRLLAEKQREAEKLREESKKKEEQRKQEEVRREEEKKLEEEKKKEQVKETIHEVEYKDKNADVQVAKAQSKTDTQQLSTREKPTTTEPMKNVTMEREKHKAGDMVAISKEEDLLIEQVLQDFLSDKP